MSTDFFTDDILERNFSSLQHFNGEVLDVLGSLTTLAERTEARLAVLETLSKRSVVVRPSKLFLLTVVTLSAYGGYKFAEKRYEDNLERDRNRTDHPAGKKVNGNNVPSPEN